MRTGDESRKATIVHIVPPFFFFPLSSIFQFPSQAHRLLRQPPRRVAVSRRGGNCQGTPSPPSASILFHSLILPLATPSRRSWRIVASPAAREHPRSPPRLSDSLFEPPRRSPRPFEAPRNPSKTRTLPRTPSNASEPLRAPSNPFKPLRTPSNAFERRRSPSTISPPLCEVP